MILLFLVAILTFFSISLEVAAGALPEAGEGTETIEIVCIGLENGDRALYDVYGSGGRKLYSVALQGKGPGKAVSRCIKGLSPGVYRVVPAGWDWTYDQNPGSIELSLRAGETITFNFQAIKRSGVMHHYEEGKLNRFASF